MRNKSVLEKPVTSGGGSVTDVTGSTPVVSSGGTTPDISLVNNAGTPAEITAVDIGTIANSDTVIPTSKAVYTGLGLKANKSGDTFTGDVDFGVSGTGVDVDIYATLGTELCPAMTQALWTEGAGWTINDGAGTATRVASAVTTLEPTTPIVPSTSKGYKVVLTISSWTAGEFTVTFGGVVSTPLSGDQVVSLYFDPYTTGNLIINPCANCAAVISLVSVKEITKGTLTVENEIMHYDSRGHSNRLSHMTRHINELASDTLLDRSISYLSCTGGVLTYTLYAIFGKGTFNFNGVVYPEPVSSASVTLTAGTDAAPQINYVNFQLVGNTPTLFASTVYPTANHIDVGTFTIGTVSGSSYTIYSYDRNRYEGDSFNKRVIERFEKAGTLYSSGGVPTVTQTTLSIASGCEFFNGIFKMTSANTTTLAGFTIIKNGAFSAATSIAETLFYSNGTAVGNHNFANVVWGIVPTTTTAGGTVATTVKLYAILQTKPTVEYTLAQARQDLYEATNYFPSNSAVKNVFVPICRTIVSEDNPTQFQTFDTGLYHKDIRGKITSGGGAATPTDLSGLVPKTTTITATAPILIDNTTSADLSANRTLSITPSNTTTAGSIVAATAPAAGLRSILAIDNGETARSDKALFDTTHPSALGTATEGTAMTAARIDHVHSSTLTSDLNFATYKAVAMTCDNGATAPSTPVVGQWFLHTPTGRNVLMMYSGTAWQSIISFGSMTMYVDSTDGTDSQDKGTGVDAAAFKTVQYAINNIPGVYSGNVTININGESYAENIIVRGKAPSGNYSITLSGTLTNLEEITSCTPTQGSATTRSLVTKVGAFNKSVNDYSNKMAFFATDVIYRIIDGHASVITFNSGGTNPIAVGDIIKGNTSGAFADVLSVAHTSGSWVGGDEAGTLVIFVTAGTWQNGETIYNITDSSADDGTTTSTASDSTDSIVIVGPLSSATSQTVIIYGSGTSIQSLTYACNVTLVRLLITRDTAHVIIGSNNALLTLNFSFVITNGSFMCINVVTASITVSFCFINATVSGGQCLNGSSFGQINFYHSKSLKNVAAFYNTRLYLNSGAVFYYGSVFDGGTYGISIESNSVAGFYNIAAMTYSRIRNCTTGLYAAWGAQSINTSTSVIKTNVTNTNAVALSFGYIG